MYLRSSHVEVSSLYQGVPATAPVTLINGTRLRARFHWGKVSEPALGTSSPGGGGGGCCPSGAPGTDAQPPSRNLAFAPQCPECPEKLGPSKELHNLSGFFLARLQGIPGPCLRRSLGCAQLDLPARDWSAQLLAAQPRGGREPTLHTVAEGPHPCASEAAALCSPSSGPPRAAYVAQATLDRCEVHPGWRRREGACGLPHQ